MDSARFFDVMTKAEFKAKQRDHRIAQNPIGERIGKLIRGEVVSTFDNSAAWQLRDQIAGEIAPEIRKRQLAWANMAQN